VCKPKVKQEIINKLKAHAAELSARVIAGKLTFAETDGLLGAYMFGLVKEYGAEVVYAASQEFAASLNANTTTH
jgi:hypothetical protein